MQRLLLRHLCSGSRRYCTINVVTFEHGSFWGRPIGAAHFQPLVTFSPWGVFTQIAHTTAGMFGSRASALSDRRADWSFGGCVYPGMSDTLHLQVFLLDLKWACRASLPRMWTEYPLLMDSVTPTGIKPATFQSRHRFLTNRHPLHPESTHLNNLFPVWIIGRFSRREYILQLFQGGWIQRHCDITHVPHRDSHLYIWIQAT